MSKKFLALFISITLTLPIFLLASETVDINTATPEQLETLTGIGSVKAQAIIGARPFSSLDDLLRVKGIGEKTLQKIKEQGLACVACEATQESSNFQNPNSKQIPNPNNEIQNTSIIYPDGIFINEIMPSPEGADENNEWTELYNSNNFEVDLSGWKIQDSAGTQTTYIIKEKISAFGFLVFKRPETKITLNNEEDGLVLLTPDGTIKNSINFGKAPMGQSYNKSEPGWQWSSKPTPGATNVITATAAKAPSTSSGPNGLPKTKKSDTNNTTEAGLASISNITNKNQDVQIKNPWFLFFTALAIAIISATAVLLLKYKFKNLKI